jgi:alkylated DNA repair protein (DNA oxidative demethylase)
VPDDLFPETILTPGLTYLPRYVAGKAPLLDELDAIVAAAPFRQMSTPGGKLMSVAMSNCGAVGWVTDRKGYRYAEHDPLTGAPWPAMPASWLALAAAAAEAGGFTRHFPYGQPTRPPERQATRHPTAFATATAPGWSAGCV